MSNLLYSLISFILALFFILLGIVSVMIPWSGEIRYGLIKFILEDSLAISLFGFIFIIVGLAICANIVLSARHQYYRLKCGAHSLTIDQAAISQYLTAYWKQLFPLNDVPCGLSIKGNKAHIDVSLPYLPLNEQRQLLERIKTDLENLFENQLGYQDEFYLSASFQNAPKTP